MTDPLMQPPIRRFTARFDSTCEDCFGAIFEGEVAGYIEDEVCCERCCDGAEADDEP